MESVPGLSSDFNTFYTSLEDALKLGDLVKSFNKGRIVILTVNMPIPCPGAPGKFAILLDAYLHYIRGDEVRKNVEISFLWPIGLIGPPAYNEVASPVFGRCGSGGDYQDGHRHTLPGIDRRRRFVFLI